MLPYKEKRILADVINLRSLTWGIFPGLSRQALDIITSLFKGEVEETSLQRRKLCKDGTGRDLKILSAGLEDGAKGHESRKTKNAGLESGRGKERALSPRLSPGSMALPIP